MEYRYVVSSDGANPYSPANHSGTTNQRVISRETVGAKYLEVLIGTIEKGHGALRCLHVRVDFKWGFQNGANLFTRVQ